MRYTGDSTEYQVSGQIAGLWYYRVRASNAYGNSAWSNTRSVSVIPSAPVLAPIDNPDGAGDYVVDWSDVPGVTSYRLEEDDNPGFASPVVRYSGANSAYQVVEQPTGLWYYRVRGTCAGGDGPWSNTESVTVLPAAPVLFAISNPDGNGSYLVDWSDVSDATSYRLEEDDNLYFTSPAERYTGANTQFQVNGQEAGVWYYRVRASNALGDGPWSNTESVGVLPAAPALYDISNPDADGVYLVDWSTVSGATSYRLEEDDNSSFTSPTERYTGPSSQFQVSGQDAGTWYYRVRASNAAGEGAWSNTESVGVAPDAPVLFAISNPNGDGDYLVDWSEVTGATEYELEEDDNSAFTSPTVRYTGADSQYQVGSQPYGTWYYRVRAANAGGDSPWSNVQSVDVDQVAPSAPVLYPISNPNGSSTYLVDWSSVAGATSYVLEEDDNSGFTSPIVRYTGDSTEYQVSGQIAGLWYYRVRASNAYGNSAWSNTRSVSVMPSAPVLAPIDNPDGAGDYVVDWSDVPGVTSYRLEEDDNPGFASPVVRYSGANSAYQVVEQPTGLWYYRVRGTCAGGDGPWSNTESVTVLPAAPVLFAISNPDGNGSYLVDWSDVSGATSYRLEEDDNLYFTSPTERYTGANTQFQVNGQDAGVWYYRVRGSNALGDGPWSNTESVGVLPAAPALYDISNPDADGVYLVDWSPVSGATSYRLEEDDNSSFTSPTERYTGPSSQFQVSGQDAGTWYYRVRASNAAGEGAWSNTESAGVAPDAPVLFAISNPNGDGDYLVDWSEVIGATEYELEEDDNSAFTSPTVRYSGAASQYQVAGQSYGTWYYRVRARSAEGDSPWSNVESVDVDQVAPSAPVLYPISNPNGSGTYLVDWSSVAGATSYRLEEDDNPAFTSPAMRYAGGDSQYEVTGQTSDVWYYRARASNAYGNSPWSNTESVTVLPAAPVLQPIGNPDGNGDYLVDWSDVTGATSYRLEEDDNAAFTSPTARYEGSGTQYQVNGQQTGLWYYRVRAANALGDSPWSNTETVAVILDAPVLYAISNPDGNGDYVVAWSDVSGAMSYRLEEDDNASFTSPVARYEGAGSQYALTGQQLGTWYYRVLASNAGGDSPWSNTESVVVSQSAYDAPDLYPISNPNGDRDYVVVWSSVSGVAGYELEEDDNPYFSSPVTRYDGSGTEFEVSGQGNGTWYYRVRAYGANGSSPWSVTRFVVVGGRIYLPLILRGF